MTELASHLQSTLGSGLEPDDANRWATLAPVVAAKGLEAALLEIAPTPGLETAIVACTAEIMASREQAIVAQVFAKTRTLGFTRLLPHLLKPELGLPVVTTNYDRLIEIAAHHVRWPFRRHSERA